MQFHRMTWANLFSFGPQPQELQLDQEGIIAIRGTNKDEGTSNGAGKCVHQNSHIIVRYNQEALKQLLGDDYDDFVRLMNESVSD